MRSHRPVGHNDFMDPPEQKDGKRGALPNALVAPVRGLSRRVRPPRPRPSKSSVSISAIVDCASYRKGVRQESESVDEAFEQATDSPDTFVWLGLNQPTIEELTDIAERFQLHPLAVEDAVHANQRPKVETYGDSLFAVIKTVRYVDHTEVIETGDITTFLGEDFIVTVRHGEGSALSDVRAELEGRPEVLATGPSAVLWAVADRVVDEYAIALEGLAEDVEEVEAAVFDSSVTTPTERIYKLKREVMEFRRVVEPLEAALMPIVDGRIALIDNHTAPYFRDVQDHSLHYENRLDTLDELLSDALQANVALVTLRLNEDVRKITAWAAILAVITSIAGIYGMNFENMPELHWANGYFVTLGFMAAIAAALYALFRHRHWL